MAEVFEVKAIKPKRLKVKPFRLEIKRALLAEGRDVKVLYEKTIHTWKRRPDFEIIIDVSAGDASVLVGTDNEIYKFVDEGTKRHPIRARRYPTLQYRKGGFVPKTRPGQLKSSRGRAATGPIRRPVEVMHPGNKPRGFTPAIQKKRRKPFTKRMVRAMVAGGKQAF